MKVLLLLTHPTSTAFNQQMAQVGVERLTALGHDVTLADLYAEGFDPAQATPAAIAQERDRLAEHDLLLCQFPLWWFRPPAMLIGWFEQVLPDAPLYAGKRVLFSATAGGSPSTYKASGVSQEPRELFQPLLEALERSGFLALPSFVAWGMLKAGEADRCQHREALGVHIEEWVRQGD
ncbi:MAG TPA: NAD(P)H-dependent oxidoreductase [Symbiobacteriaceae bacterium]|nr:NAD(P)H-dependent oxidoreductase [Symbiobacteriaceae bacterium]